MTGAILVWGRNLLFALSELASTCLYAAILVDSTESIQHSEKLEGEIYYSHLAMCLFSASIVYPTSYLFNFSFLCKAA
jgi:hypothetical protein